MSFRTLLQRLRHWWNTTPQRLLLTQQLSGVLPQFRGTVLDIGGGRAAAHDAFWSADVKRIRIDISDVHSPDIIADALMLPIADQQVDVVVAFEVLEHVRNPDLLVAEALRVLRPGGYFCATAPFISPVHGDPHDYFRFTAGGFRVLTAGFSRVDVTPYGNQWSAGWVLISTQSRLIRLANPLMRRTGRRTNERCPGGHMVVAMKAEGARGAV